MEEQLSGSSSVANFTLIDPRQSCPICCLPITASDGLYMHLANHLERIAAFSLPRNVGTANEEGEEGQVEGSSATSPRSAAVSDQAKALSGSLPSGSTHSVLSARHVRQVDERSRLVEPQLQVESRTTRLKRIREIETELEHNRRMAEFEHSRRMYEIRRNRRANQIERRNQEKEGRDREAMGFLNAAEENKKVLGEEHPDTLHSLRQLATSYSNLGRYQEASELEEKILEVYKRMLGEEYPITLSIDKQQKVIKSAKKYGKHAPRLEFDFDGVIPFSSRKKEPNKVVSVPPPAPRPPSRRATLSTQPEPITFTQPYTQSPYQNIEPEQYIRTALPPRIVVSDPNNVD